MAVKGAQNWSASNCATSELLNSNSKKNSYETHCSLLRRRLRASLYNLILFLHIRFRKRETVSQQIIK